MTRINTYHISGVLYQESPKIPIDSSATAQNKREPGGEESSVWIDLDRWDFCDVNGVPVVRSIYREVEAANPHGTLDSFQVDGWKWSEGAVARLVTEAEKTGTVGAPSSQCWWTGEEAR